MSGPKYVEFDIPKYVEFDVRLNTEEKAEFVAAISRLRGGVSIKNGVVRVDDSSHYTVTQIKQMVEDAKREIVRREEERAKARLISAKAAEEARMKSVAVKVTEAAGAELKAVERAVKACNGQKRDVPSATKFTGLTNISPQKFSDTLSREIARLEQVKTEIVRARDKRLAEIEKYRSTVQGQPDQKALSRAIETAPAQHVVYPNGTFGTETLCGEVSAGIERFSRLKKLLNKVSEALETDEELKGAAAKMNAVISSCDITSAKSISDCMNSIGAIQNEVLVSRRTAAFAASNAALSALENELKDFAFEVAAPPPAKPIPAKEICEKHVSAIRAAICAIEDLSYLAPESRSEFADLKRNLDSIERSGFSSSEIKNLSGLESKMIALQNKCKRIESDYTEFESYNRSYSETVKRLGADLDFLNLVPVTFIAERAAECIKTVKSEWERLNKVLNERSRDLMVGQLKVSLEKTAGFGQDYRRFREEIMDDGSIQLSYAKADALGLAYVWKVELGGAAKRIPMRVADRGGRFLIDEERFIKRQHEDCGDMTALSEDITEMGFEMSYRELATPEESFDKNEMLQLKDEQEEERYIKAVYGEEDYGKGYSIFNNVANGMTLDLAESAAEYAEDERPAGNNAALQQREIK